MSVPSHPPANLPLAFGNRQARLDHDPDQLAQMVSQAVPLRDLTPSGAAGPFGQCSIHVRVAQLGITAAAHSPLRGRNHAHNKAVFTLPSLGEKRFTIAGGTYRARAGHCALFLPGEAYSLETTLCSGVMFSLCPRELAGVATAMVGLETGLRLAPIERPVEILESHPRQGKMLSLLRRGLRLIDLAVVNGASVPRQLGLDDKIQRLIALMVYPQLTATGMLSPQRLGRHERATFAELVDTIQKDPLTEWTLTRMERQTGFSHVRLRRHFQEAFGCGPSQWLRHQRLCWARQRLDAWDPIPLSHLARMCGYVDAGRFRDDFEAHFLLSPDSIQPGLAF
ncbi:MAG: helix-turn-helix domain-containing protein [Cyanobacteriota bacterium]